MFFTTFLIIFNTKNILLYFEIQVTYDYSNRTSFYTKLWSIIFIRIEIDKNYSTELLHNSSLNISLQELLKIKEEVKLLDSRTADEYAGYKLKKGAF